VLYRAPQAFDANDDATAWLSPERRQVEFDEWVSPTDRRGERMPRGMTLESYSDQWLEDRVLKRRTPSTTDRSSIGPLPTSALQRVP